VKLENFEDFLNDKNSRLREAILNYRLFYDLKLAAAFKGYNLNIFIPDVDREGYDIIIDNECVIRKLQLKTVLKSVKTSEWDILKMILCPDDKFINLLDSNVDNEFMNFFYFSGDVVYRTFMPGGVILMELEPEDEDKLNVIYYYTDIFIISALKNAMVKRKPAIQENVLNKFIRKLKLLKPDQKKSVSKSFFVRVKSPGALLDLIGFCGKDGHPWFIDFLRIYKKNSNESILKATVANKLSQLTDNLISNYE
jgi:hypothetical protein